MADGVFVEYVLGDRFVPDIPLEQHLGHFDNQKAPKIPCDIIFYFSFFGQTSIAVKDRVIQRGKGEGLRG